MIDELNRAIGRYMIQWGDLVAARNDKAFFADVKPTAVAWKAKDLPDFDQRVSQLRDASDQVHIAWLGERWLATFHLKGRPLSGGLRVVKLMQRRPGSLDNPGLDHLDFFTPDIAVAKKILGSEPALKWTPEAGGDHCKWLSIWFNGTEAKIRDNTVLDVCAAELLDIKTGILT